MRTNLQIGIEQLGVAYDMPLTLLAQACKIFKISVRDFARIFGISKSYAAEIINHEKMPSLELAIRISRYFYMSTEDMFGWRVEDTGERRPEAIELPGTGQWVVLSSGNKTHGTLEIIKMVADALRGKRGG